MTATENLRVFATLRGVPNNHAIQDALDLVGLPYKDKKLFSQYSLGMKQRLAIALAVMHDPELLILDEPINGLDPSGIVEFRSILQQLNEQKMINHLSTVGILGNVILTAFKLLAGIIGHSGAMISDAVHSLSDVFATFHCISRGKII